MWITSCDSIFHMNFSNFSIAADIAWAEDETVEIVQDFWWSLKLVRQNFLDMYLMSFLRVHFNVDRFQAAGIN